MSAIKIDKGVPMPSRMKYPFEEMEVGDSFLVLSDNRTSVSTLVGRHQNGKKFSLRKMTDGTYRCWRIA